MKHFLPALITTFFIISAAYAKEHATDTSAKKILPPIQRFYIGGAADGAIFSTATIKHTTLNGTASPDITNTYGTLRFSYIFNFGFSFNFNYISNSASFWQCSIC